MVRNMSTIYPVFAQYLCSICSVKHWTSTGQILEKYWRSTGHIHELLPCYPLATKAQYYGKAFPLHSKHKKANLLGWPYYVFYFQNPYLITNFFAFSIYRTLNIGIWPLTIIRPLRLYLIGFFLEDIHQEP